MFAGSIKTAKGFKDVSALTYIDSFDVVNGIVPDYMHAVTKRQVRSEIEIGKAVKQVFSDNYQSENQPRDSKFIHNLKYAVNKEINPGNKQNIADDMQNEINMLSNSHPFLKEIVVCW